MTQLIAYGYTYGVPVTWLLIILYKQYLDMKERYNNPKRNDD